MAIPVEYFRYKLGVALMRRRDLTGEWFFVTWVGNGVSYVLNLEGGETHTFQLWLIFGGDTNPALAQTGLDGVSVLSVLKANK